jgi:hypothetical protein
LGVPRERGTPSLWGEMTYQALVTRICTMALARV